MWVPGQAVKTRTDALQYAAWKMLEQFRPMLDGPSQIKSVTLDLKITPENFVRTALLSPEFEAHPIERPQIERYSFADSTEVINSSFSQAPIVCIK